MVVWQHNSLTMSWNRDGMKVCLSIAICDNTKDWKDEGGFNKCLTTFLLWSAESRVCSLPNIWEVRSAPFLQNFPSNFVDSMSRQSICRTSTTSERRSTKFRRFLSTSNEGKSTAFLTLRPLSSFWPEEFANRTSTPWPGWAWHGSDGSGLHLEVKILISERF